MEGRSEVRAQPGTMWQRQRCGQPQHRTLTWHAPPATHCPARPAVVVQASLPSWLAQAPLAAQIWQEPHPGLAGLLQPFGTHTPAAHCPALPPAAVQSCPVVASHRPLG